MVIKRRKKFFVFVGHDWRRNARLRIFIGWGYRFNGDLGQDMWAHHWELSSHSLPSL